MKGPLFNIFEGPGWRSPPSHPDQSAPGYTGASDLQASATVDSHPGWVCVGGKGKWLFCLRMGGPFSLTCTDLRIETLHWSLPDFKCEIDVNIGFS